MRYRIEKSASADWQRLDIRLQELALDVLEDLPEEPSEVEPDGSFTVNVKEAVVGQVREVYLVAKWQPLEKLAAVIAVVDASRRGRS